MRKQVWFGAVVCAVLIVPCFIVGALVSSLVNLLNFIQIGPESDVLFLRTLFGIKAPGEILDWLIFTAVPAVLQGGITGALAIYLTAKIYVGKSIEIVAYTTGALYTGIVLMAFVVAMLNAGFKLTYLQALLQFVGMWIGLITMLQELPSVPSPSRT